MTPEELAAVSEKTGDELVAYGREILALGQSLLKNGSLLRNQVPRAVPPPKPEEPSEDHSVGRLGLVDEDIAVLKARELKQFTRLEFEQSVGLKGTATSRWLNKLMERDIIERGQDEDGHIVYRYIRSLADEDPLFQIRGWAKRREGTFDLTDVINETKLPEPEVVTAITQLVVEGVIAAEQIVDEEEIDPADRVAMTVYHYVAPMAGGVQSELERQRLANVLEVPAVRRGQPVRIRTERKQGRARSTPGSRQKVINQDRNWERLEAARKKREEEGRERAARRKAEPKAKRGRKSKAVQ